MKAQIISFIKTQSNQAREQLNQRLSGIKRNPGAAGNTVIVGAAAGVLTGSAMAAFPKVSAYVLIFGAPLAAGYLAASGYWRLHRSIETQFDEIQDELSQAIRTLEPVKTAV